VTLSSSPAAINDQVMFGRVTVGITCEKDDGPFPFVKRVQAFGRRFESQNVVFAELSIRTYRKVSCTGRRLRSEKL
jgi:hypothetical protein